MKKYLGLFLVLSMALTAAVQEVGAEENTNPDTSVTPEARTKAKDALKIKREAMKAEIKAERERAKLKIEALKSQIKEEKNAAKAKIKETRIGDRENALERFDAAVLRIDNLKSRINLKIAKLEEKGVDVEKASELLASAEANLDAAKVKVAEANVLLSASADELGKEDKAKLKILAKDIQDLIKGAHKTLNDAVKSLKDATKVKIETQKTL